MKSIFLPLVLALILSACATHSDKAEVQVFYYNFVGFDSSEELSELLELMKAEYAFNDYIITSHEELTTFPRESEISKDSLHSMHSVIHRIEPIESTDRLKEGAIVIEVSVVPVNGAPLPSFAYKRFIINEKEALELKLDFGVHPLLGVSAHEFLLRWSYIAEEFARVSYK